MGFNYASEKRRFDKEWQKLAKQYCDAGFDEAGIHEMYEFDWAWFRQRRAYENRVQTLPSETIDDSDDGSNSTLFKKFPPLSISFSEEDFQSRYGWIGAVSDPVLSDKLSKLPDDDKELLTLLAFDGFTQAEIAALRGCSQVAVSKKIRRLKNFLFTGL